MRLVSVPNPGYSVGRWRIVLVASGTEAPLRVTLLPAAVLHPEHGDGGLRSPVASQGLLIRPLDQIPQLGARDIFSGPGEEEGDGGRQKSQSDDRSHTLPPQLSGEQEDSDPGDRRLDPAVTSPCGSTLESNSSEPTCAYVSKNSVQSVIVIVKVAWLVVAVRPFALHQEGPRHVVCVSLRLRLVASQVRNRPLNSSALRAALTLSLVRLEHHWSSGEIAFGFFGGPLRMRIRPGSFT
ncbi:unnamed protein product, partial [Menidia menidia]